MARDLLQHGNIVDPLAGRMAFVLGLFISLLMWSFGLIWLVFALATILLKFPFPFNMGWWGFTFPLGVYAANTMQLGTQMDLMFFKVFGTVSTFGSFSTSVLAVLTELHSDSQWCGFTTLDLSNIEDRTWCMAWYAVSRTVFTKSRLQRAESLCMKFEFISM